MQELSRSDLINIILTQRRIYGEALTTLSNLLENSGFKDWSTVVSRLRDNYGLGTSITDFRRLEIELKMTELDTNEKLVCVKLGARNDWFHGGDLWRATQLTQTPFRNTINKLMSRGIVERRYSAAATEYRLVR